MAQSVRVVQVYPTRPPVATSMCKMLGVNIAQRPFRYTARPNCPFMSRFAVTKATHIARLAPTDVVVLDFDGVLLDSEGEITRSAFVAAKQRWPKLFAGVSAEQQEAVAKKMRKVRPVLVRFVGEHAA